MTSIKTIALAILGLTTFSAATYGQTYSSGQIGLSMMRLNASFAYDKQQMEHYARSGSVWGLLRGEFRMQEVNPELVRRHESKFSGSRAYFDRTVARSAPYIFHIANEVHKRNMPGEIALLPFIESAFVNKARSPVGASGLWQFMPATGRHYGLEQTPLYDGRHDVYAATDAALNYLEYLYGLFGDWSLALAAYNWGEGNVGRAIERARAQGLDPVYENLRMPNETRNYVPKLLAVRNIVASPDRFGISLREVDNKPYFAAVDVQSPIDIQAAARLANISESEFLALNPAFKSPVFIPKNGRKMLLPVSAVTTFEDNYRQADPKTLVSWDVYTPYTKTNLASIAEETGMTVSELKSLNDVRGNNVAAGRSILVAKNSLDKGHIGVNFANLDVDSNPDDNKLQAVPAVFKEPTIMATDNWQQKELKPITTESEVVVAKAVEVKNIPVVAGNTLVPTNMALTNAKVTQDIVVATPVQAANTLPPVAAKVGAQAEAQVAQVKKVDAAALKVSTDLEQAAPSQTVVDGVIADKLPELVVVDPKTAQDAQDSLDDPLLALVDAKHAQQVVAAVMKGETSQPVHVAAKADGAAKPVSRQNDRVSRSTAKTGKSTAKTYKVDSGDTLYSIAQRYEISVEDLQLVNNLKGNSIRPGQVLKVVLDDKAKKQIAKLAANKSSKARVQNVSYTVRKGDTLVEIARKFNLDVKDVRRLNGNTTRLMPGQKLKLVGS